MGKGDQILYAPQYLDAVIEYYLPDRPARSITTPRSQLKGARRIFVVASFLDHHNMRGAPELCSPSSSRSAS